MSLPAVLIRKSTGEIIKHANYPRVDMELVEGLDPDLEWLLKYEPFVQPDYDSRIFLLVATEAITTTQHPDYLHLNQYLRTYTTERRSDEDIILSIENAETNANEQLMKYQTRTKMFTLALGVLIKRLDNLNTSPKEQVVLDKMLSIAVNVWKNDSNLQAKLQQVTDGEEPNIDSLWENLS